MPRPFQAHCVAFVVHSIIEQIGQTLTSLRDRLGLTIVLVVQKLDFITTVSQRVLVIKRGRLGDEIPREHLASRELGLKYLSSRE